MEIKPGQKIYKKTSDPDVFIELWLVSRKVKKSRIKKRLERIDDAISSAKKPVSYPASGTDQQKKAIDYYNKIHAKDMTSFEKEKAELETILAGIEGAQ